MIRRRRCSKRKRGKKGEDNKICFCRTGIRRGSYFDFTLDTRMAPLLIVFEAGNHIYFVIKSKTSRTLNHQHSLGLQFQLIKNSRGNSDTRNNKDSPCPRLNVMTLVGGWLA